jgi:hypothetical protein
VIRGATTLPGVSFNGSNGTAREFRVVDGVPTFEVCTKSSNWRCEETSVRVPASALRRLSTAGPKDVMPLAEDVTSAKGDPPLEEGSASSVQEGQPPLPEGSSSNNNAASPPSQEKTGPGQGTHLRPFRAPYVQRVRPAPPKDPPLREGASCAVPTSSLAQQFRALQREGRGAPFSDADSDGDSSDAGSLGRGHGTNLRGLHGGLSSHNASSQVEGPGSPSTWSFLQGLSNKTLSNIQPPPPSSPPTLLAACESVLVSFPQLCKSMGGDMDLLYRPLPLPADLMKAVNDVATVFFEGGGRPFFSHAWLFMWHGKGWGWGCWVQGWGVVGGGGGGRKG